MAIDREISENHSHHSNVHTTKVGHNYLNLYLKLTHGALRTHWCLVKAYLFYFAAVLECDNPEVCSDDCTVVETIDTCVCPRTKQLAVDQRTCEGEVEQHH